MRLFFVLLISLLLTMPGFCGEPIKVGVLIGPPFVIKHETTYSGIAVELWDAIAQAIEQPYSYVEFACDQTDEALDSLGKGNIEVLIGPLSVSQKGLEVADYTLPYFVDKIIAISSYEYLHNVLRFIKLMFYSIGGIIALFFLVFIFYIHLLWYYERQHATHIPHQYKEGVTYLFWAHVLMGHHAEVPKTWPGRFLLLFKTASFYVILIILNATLISFLTVSLSRWADPIQSLLDLEKRKVGGIVNSRPYKVGKSLGLRILPFGSLQEGLQALEGEQIGAFLADLSQADTYLKGEGRTNLSISHYELRQDLYSFATHIGSPLLKKINMQMAELRKNDIPQKICKGYLNAGIKNCEL
ncbi:MAG: transporter substrate-binding domain-containing protein [Alphaproteobacteria bacterium]|nr:transporter substrate-binding domain-containing protein [Alphaproteobacteria bacterium]